MPTVSRGSYKKLWDFSQKEKEELIARLAEELPALRGKVGVSQDMLAAAVGISRQTYSSYETQAREIPWSMYLALVFYFDSIPSTHNLLRQMNVYPKPLDECWEAANLSKQGK